LRGLEGLLDSPIFAGVKGENGHSPAKSKAEWQGSQQRIKRSKFLVHLDADGLEHASDGFF
jgi:hypothetical protein